MLMNWGTQHKLGSLGPQRAGEVRLTHPEVRHDHESGKTGFMSAVSRHGQWQSITEFGSEILFCFVLFFWKDLALFDPEPFPGFHQLSLSLHLPVCPHCLLSPYCHQSVCAEVVCSWDIGKEAS